jgi:hypothetical protein
MVYAMDTSTGRLVQVVKSVGVITVTAAPIGGKAIIVLPEEHSNGRAWLYDGSAAAGQLPLDFSFINPYFVVWTADAERVMFYGGSTIDADAWNILGVVALRNLTVSKVKLFAPTEQVYVCPGTGHIFTGMPGIDRSGHLEIGRAVEYGADLRLISTANILPAGNFSATCRYVATPSSAHGPIPWRIVDGRNGRELMYFEFTGGESGKEEFEFRSWNPKRDHLLLRTRYRPGGPNGTATDLEVFDISRRVVVESLPGFSGEAAWSADGRSLIVSRGRSIVFHLVPDPSRPLNSR